MFCEINEGVCFTKAKKMNPEECDTECKINEMQVPTFYDLERILNFIIVLSILAAVILATRICW